jgi:NADH-quinone oxidoreductase subunit A
MHCMCKEGHHHLPLCQADLFLEKSLFTTRRLHTILTQKHNLAAARSPAAAPQHKESDPILNEPSVSASTLWPLLVFFAASVILVVVMVSLSAMLGQRHKERTTGVPYESGIIPTGSALIRFDVKFYLMAMFFVIFDLEAVFIYAWAVNARQLGWPGYVEIILFIGFLVLALFYLWRVGALDWSTARHRQASRTTSACEPTGL